MRRSACGIRLRRHAAAGICQAGRRSPARQARRAVMPGQFMLLAMQAGLPPVRLHDLRQGAATILLRAGRDLKVVQETLGLSSITDRLRHLHRRSA
ncbi:tyrosine-type recombinase/integrase [Actinomadura syzygii]|uniref:tyrosine-type recombinase/integrase n=1 Tax=Actinomadura syzygii TaxID=1427538 RepID=UPI003CCC598B